MRKFIFVFVLSFILFAIFPTEAEEYFLDVEINIFDSSMNTITGGIIYQSKTNDFNTKVPFMIILLLVILATIFLLRKRFDKFI